MHTVDTLQQKLERQALQQAEREVGEALNALPYFEHIRFQRDDKQITVENYQVITLLSHAMVKRRTGEILERLTRDLLDTVNRVNELANGLDEVASRGA